MTGALPLANSKPRPVKHSIRAHEGGRRSFNGGSAIPMAQRIAEQKGRVAEAERGSGAKVNPVLG